MRLEWLNHDSPVKLTITPLKNYILSKLLIESLVFTYEIEIWEETADEQEFHTREVEKE